MQEVVLSLLILLAGLPALDANDPEDKNSPFYYDWYGLRVGGLIFAGILCAMGIIVLMSEWEMQMQVPTEAQPPFRRCPTSHHSRLCPKLLRMDQQKELQGLLFPQVLALQGSLNSRMEFSTPSSDHLARAPSHLSLDGSWFSFYSKMILPHTQAALRLPIFALVFLVGRAEGSCSWGLARKLAAKSLHWDETTSLLPHDLVDGMGPLWPWEPHMQFKILYLGDIFESERELEPDGILDPGTIPGKLGCGMIPVSRSTQIAYNSEAL